MVVTDMPFMSYQLSGEEALRNAGKIMKEHECDAVKLEGGRVIAETVKRITDVGIPVMGHLGLMPQSIYKYGSYRVRAQEEREAEQLLEDAKILEQAGAFAIVLEKIPSALAAQVTKSLTIPAIGIGAGIECDGQVLVSHDMLGLQDQPLPRFVKRYAELAPQMRDAFAAYAKEVADGTFPRAEHGYEGGA